MSSEVCRDLSRRLGNARRHLAAADQLVEVARVGKRRRWRSVLADGPSARLEREAAAALDRGDVRSAREAIERLEHAAARARRNAEARP